MRLLDMNREDARWSLLVTQEGDPGGHYGEAEQVGGEVHGISAKVAR